MVCSHVAFFARAKQASVSRPREGSEEKVSRPGHHPLLFLGLVLAVPTSSCYPDPSAFEFLPPGTGQITRTTE